MSFFQIQQFMQEHSTKVLVMGAKQPDRLDPPLVENNQFAPNLFSRPEDVRRLELHFVSDEPGVSSESATRQVGERPGGSSGRRVRGGPVLPT